MDLSSSIRPPAVSSERRLTVVRTLAVLGVEARPVRLECAVSGGLPGLRLVGLPDAAVREAGERVRAALQRTGFRWPPMRIVVNLAPADLPKVGTGFDLPLALAVLAASGQVEPQGLDGVVVHGEVGLDGSLRGVPGVLAVAIGAQRLGASRLLVPEESASVAAVVTGLEVWPARDLAEAVALIGRRTAPRPVVADRARAEGRNATRPSTSTGDLEEVRGQPVGRRAVEVAAAGGHHLLLIGPPGCGKSMLAHRLVTVLPDLTHEEQLEVATVHGIVGGPHAVPTPRPPVRAPQTGMTAAALVGGGSASGRPGELSLAHRGVLVLDELLETPRAVLDALRQPLEEGRVVVDRSRTRVSLPARVQLVATTNPCPCGMLGHPRRPCGCRPDRIERYRSRLSGPMLDRIDLHVLMHPVPRERLTGPSDGEPTAAVARRVVRARAFAAARQGAALNRDVAAGIVQGTVEPSAHRLLVAGLERLGGSARGHDRCLRVARTVADLAASETVTEEHVAEAIGLRLTGLPGAAGARP
jgi:magnesium chelatase family protein